MTFVFTIVALLAVISALGVILAKTPINSALWLVLNLFLLASLYALLDAHFLAVAQIMIYAGAIMVLVLFVIMLLGVSSAPPKFSPFVTVSAVIGGVCFIAMMVPMFKLFADSTGSNIEGDMKSVGKVLYTTYLYPFEAASFLLISGIVGALMLAKRRKQA